MARQIYHPPAGLPPWTNTIEMLYQYLTPLSTLILALGWLTSSVEVTL